MSQYDDSIFAEATMITEWENAGICYKALSANRESIDAAPGQPALLIIGIDEGGVRRMNSMYDPCFERMGISEKEEIRDMLSHAPECVEVFARSIDLIV